MSYEGSKVGLKGKVKRINYKYKIESMKKERAARGFKGGIVETSNKDSIGSEQCGEIMAKNKGA